MKKILIMCLFLSALLVGTIDNKEGAITQVKADTIESDFFSVREYRSTLDSRIIDGERYYFILDEMQLLIFDKHLNFVKKIGHMITGPYDIEITNDLDGHGKSDILIVMKWEDEYQKGYTNEVNESGPSFAAYSFETERLIWSKYLTQKGLFSNQDEQMLVRDYEIRKEELIVAYGNSVEGINLKIGVNTFRKQFDDNIWSVSFIDDYNQDGVRDFVANKQPNHVMILDGQTGEKLKEKQIGSKIVFDDGNTISPNIWRIRYNDSSDTVGVVTEFGFFYELDLQLNEISHYEFFAFNKDTKIYKKEYSTIDGKGYTEKQTSYTYKNSDLKISEDLDGDGIKDFIILHEGVEYFYHTKIAVYYTKDKQKTYNGKIKDVLRYFNDGVMTVEPEDTEEYPRYSILDLRDDLNKSSKLNLPEGWSNNELTLIKSSPYLELYKDEELVSKTLVYNKETYKKSKYLYRYDLYGAKKDNYNYNDKVGKIKEFRQYDQEMNERFKFTTKDNEWIEEFNPLDQDENLIFIHTANDTGDHHFMIYEVGKEDAIKNYKRSDLNFEHTIATVPLFNFNSTEDYLLKIDGTRYGENGERKAGYIYIVNLNTGAQTKLNDHVINEFFPGQLTRIDLRYEIEGAEINATIFGRNGKVMSIGTDITTHHLEFTEYDAGFHLTNVEQISDLDGDGWNDYQMMEPREYLHRTSSLLLTTGQVIESKEYELLYQVDVDYNKDGIDDFIGVIYDNNRADFTIYTYDSDDKKLESIWTYTENNINLYDYTRPVIAVDQNHILFYKIEGRNSSVTLHKINVHTNEQTVKTILETYSSNLRLGGMIYSHRQHLFVELDGRIYILKDDQLVSVVKGNTVDSFHSTILINDLTYNALYMSELNKLPKNITHKTLFYNSLNIDLTEYDYNYARVMLSNVWSRLETSEQKFGYVINNDENLVIVEMFDEQGNMSLHAYEVKKLGPHTQLIGVALIGTVSTIIILIYKKRKQLIKGENN